MDTQARAFVILSSRYPQVNTGMAGIGEYNHKLKGYEITFPLISNPNPVGNNQPYTQTLFFEKHECRRIRK